FLPLVLAGYFAVRSGRMPHGRNGAGTEAAPQSLRNWILLVASVIFYARGAGAFTWLILASIVFNYLAALAIARRQGTPAAWRVLAGAVTINLLVLGVFKYAGFAVANLN